MFSCSFALNANLFLLPWARRRKRQRPQSRSRPMLISGHSMMFACFIVCAVCFSTHEIRDADSALSRCLQLLLGSLIGVFTIPASAAPYFPSRYRHFSVLCQHSRPCHWPRSRVWQRSAELVTERAVRHSLWLEKREKED